MTVKLPVSSSLFWSMKSRVMSTFPKINVSPEPSLFDEPLQIVVEGTVIAISVYIPMLR